jgi:Cdc6-like AAA superfamily ATPase
MAILDSITGGIIEYFVGKTLDYGNDYFNKCKTEGLNGFAKKDLPHIFGSHYTEVINWASDIPFIELNKNKKVAKSTIALSISTKISKFDKSTRKRNLISEIDILNLEHNVIILGKPGAGKTTTIKRLISHFFNSKTDLNYTNPILIRLREMDETDSVYTSILDIFNIPWEARKIQLTRNIKRPNGDFFPENYFATKFYIKNSDIKIESFVPNFLNETNSILFLDGYDELPVSLQKKVLKDVELIGLKLDKAKVIMTSRTSSFSKIISNFEILEIHPLSIKDIKEISLKWLSNGKEFIKELNNRKYSELANRPIFLTLLLILFEKNKTLPVSPFEVYREAVFLIIKDWDEHRGINRTSNYANFNVRKKLDFLQEVSLHLTYKIKSNLFTSDQLKEVYLNIYRKYDLPKDDLNQVVREIESHNGLINEVGYNLFEFSHLSLQEYLCAECLLSLPFSRNTITYFYERPDPLAIAVCISKDPGLWLANLLLNSNLNVTKSATKQRCEPSLIKFLSRLIEEHPLFNVSVELGLVLIYLVLEFSYSQKVFELTLELLRIKNVKESLIQTLESFTITSDIINNNFILKRTSPLANESLIIVPHRGDIEFQKWSLIKEILYT